MLLLLPALAACGGRTTVTITVTQPSATTIVRVYFLRDGKIAPVARAVPAGDEGNAAQRALAEGPTPEERALGFTSAVPSKAGAPLPRPALAQIVYTLTQFPDTPRALGHTRAEVENLTPPILVESPLPDEAVTSALRATGTANTFEATFEYGLLDDDGNVVSQHFETATSGSGTRGTFDFSVPFQAERAQSGTFVVYEISAANGKRIHEIRIPIRLTP